ncbi:flagellar hook assembly protein FlgD [Psychrosphaera sp. B3R10]|uniref:Basal-body rod modification protein FlgD n=1 Tax=Psychrosphaera algicola TaxID=3023714 RepID=A0ABT5FJD1_9GAMM|nr:MULTISPECIES: flagellar hook assembly protein FlgD [unclassified Psychrosphaera]MBU2882095.1 flagellar hook assembly protein FlgD [Psychrosphaera sp. I2R16]MBU2990183.1 flagellar hook assembly protein FlgD [Psychrosphaera sp. B3R10]MDC2891316.1 flagellar hook assembly protein FlgD [Psychrosphaera sp. G1-22]MDO6719960.1 flagellar hook assembly protein FlgD [Psychrosphaera sp. 1_MG-2023]
MIDNTISNSLTEDLRWQEESIVTNEVNGQMGQEDFYTLLTTQLSMQDPLNPTSNEDMISQMTQFTMADGITGLGDKMDSLTASMTSNQALEASSLVGRNVLLNSPMAYSDGTGFKGQVPLGSSTQNVLVEITSSTGGSVIIPYGSQQSGLMDFEWDGKDLDGNPWPPGPYEVKVTGLPNGATESESFSVLSYGNVSSVTLGQNGTGLELNIQGLGAIRLSDILAVGD